MRFINGLWASAVVASAVLAAPAAAVVTGGTLTGGTAFTNGGSFVIIASPAGLTVGQDNFQNNDVRAFNEAQGFTLLSALSVNLGSTIAAGTRVNSHYINFDPLRSRTVTGSVTFDTPILGIIWSRANLISSAFLGATGVTYLYPSAVGFELSTDSASFTGNTMNLRLTASSPGDSWRVITEAGALDGSAIPEPSSWAMLIAGFGLVGLSARRRRPSVAA